MKINIRMDLQEYQNTQKGWNISIKERQDVDGGWG